VHEQHFDRAPIAAVQSNAGKARNSCRSAPIKEEEIYVDRSVVELLLPFVRPHAVFAGAYTQRSGRLGSHGILEVHGLLGAVSGAQSVQHA
jgi:hypothetical protein